MVVGALVGVVMIAIFVLFIGAVVVVYNNIAGADTFPDDCGKVGGQVYTMDADHRVCLRNGKVVSP